MAFEMSANPDEPGQSTPRVTHHRRIRLSTQPIMWWSQSAQFRTRDATQWCRLVL